MATQFQGIVDAYDFAYGVNPNGSGALQVINGSNVAGTYTVTCAPANIVSADGITIVLGITAPITIGEDSNIETVTPTAISRNQLGQILITAVFANAHSTGDTVRSGSGGIMDAVNTIHAAGGGLIAISEAAALAIGATTNALLATYLTTTGGGKPGWANTTLLNYTGLTSTANPATSFSAAPVATPTDGGVYTTTTIRLY